MFCAKCGTQVEEGSKFCQKCGTPVDQSAQPQMVSAPPGSYQPAAAIKTSGMAIASLVLGICGISLLAIIFGIVALNQIKNSNGFLTGKGMAIAGIILGSVAIVITIIVIVALVVATPTIYYYGI
jgi:hypothetical protein